MTTINSRVIPLRLWQTQNQQLKKLEELLSKHWVNKARRSKYRNAIKKMNLLIEKKKKAEALKFLPKLNSELMKVAKTGIIKKEKCFKKCFKNYQKNCRTLE